MKKIMIVAAMMVAAVGAKAQFEPGTFSIQPKVGVSVCWLSNLPDLHVNRELLKNVGMELSKDVTLEKSVTVGELIGVEAEYQLFRSFSIAAGVNYSLQGGGWDDYEYKNGKDEVEIKDVKYQTGYITVPVTANYYLFKGFAVKAGVQFGFLTNADDCNSIESKYDKTTSTYTFETDVKDSFEKFDLSIPMGVSYQFKVPIVLDLRYNLGLTKVNKESVTGVKDMKNNVIQFTVGYKFAL